MVKRISELTRLYTTAVVKPKKKDPTAEKVISIGAQLIGPQKQTLRDRQISQLSDVDDLSSQVLNLQNHWAELAPSEIAEKLSELSDRISLCTEKENPVFQRIQEAFRICEFQYVYPLTADIDPFVENIHGVAKETLESQSLTPFKELNPMQQREVIRYAKGGA